MSKPHKANFLSPQRDQMLVITQKLLHAFAGIRSMISFRTSFKRRALHWDVLSDPESWSSGRQACLTVAILLWSQDCSTQTETNYCLLSSFTINSLSYSNSAEENSAFLPGVMNDASWDGPQWYGTHRNYSLLHEQPCRVSLCTV